MLVYQWFPATGTQRGLQVAASLARSRRTQAPLRGSRANRNFTAWGGGRPGPGVRGVGGSSLRLMLLVCFLPPSGGPPCPAVSVRIHRRPWEVLDGRRFPGASRSGTHSVPGSRGGVLSRWAACGTAWCVRDFARLSMSHLRDSLASPCPLPGRGLPGAPPLSAAGLAASRAWSCTPRTPADVQ